jgi:metal iron transporter
MQTLIDPSALYLGVGIIGGTQLGISQLTSATVMPHALFLGSHLSTVDRLNMLPIAPQPRRSFRDFAMPSLKLFRRKSATPAPAPSEQIELAGLEIERIQSGDSKRFDLSQPAGFTDQVPELDDVASVDEREKDMLQRQKDYEEDMKRFDRIKWADIHLKHATVRCLDKNS